MERFEEDLIAALRELRPQPRPEFAAELDARTAAGFPRKRRFGVPSLTGVRERLRALKPRQVLLPAGAVVLAIVLVGTVVVMQRSDGGTSDSGGGFLNALSDEPSDEAASSAPSGGDPTITQAEVSPAAAQPTERAGGPASRNRAIERAAEMTVATAPEDVGEATSEAFAVVHASRGIVLRSQTEHDDEGAWADFELLIPSGRLSDALAGFSRIGEVVSRQETTADITAPTVTAAEHLRDSRARIDGLLAQLAEASEEGEREAVEGELRTERRHAAGLRSRLQGLDRRAGLSRISLTIIGGELSAAPGAEDGSWGVADALEDARQVLGVAAAVTLLALAVLAPLALIALLAWLARRTYLRRARRHALG